MVRAANCCGQEVLLLIIITCRFKIQCCFFSPGYNITAEITTSPPSELHVTHTLVTLTCHACPGVTLQPDQTLHLAWSRNGNILFNTTRHTISAKTLENGTEDLLGSGVTLFGSSLTIHSVEPPDNSTYTCSAAVVSSSTGQPLSSSVHTSVTIRVIGKQISSTDTMHV